MKLHKNQIGLLRHLARFQMLAYPDCLEMLDTDHTGDRTALSYAFRPLTKNKYVSRQKDGSVSILAKGRALFPDITPLISAGGGAAERRRVMAVSRMAALMERSGIPLLWRTRDRDEPYFIPLRLLAEHCPRHPVHYPLYRDADGRAAPAGRL